MKMMQDSRRRQTGQVLIYVTLMVALGSAILGPLLLFTYIGHRTVQLREQRMLELYAADAGIEDAMYQIKDNVDPIAALGYGDGDTHDPGTPGWNDRDMTVAIKKVWITALGKMWTGVTIRNEQLLASAETFVRECRWRGPFEIECILKGDEPWLVEINPRFPAWSYCATGVGLNLPAQLLRLSLGMPLSPVRDYEAGKLFIRYSSELVTDMIDFQKLVTRGEVP